jgi:hypothetical protein
MASDFVEFVGFAIPDEFVVGYGIDYAQRYRHLPYIGKVIQQRTNGQRLRLAQTEDLTHFRQGIAGVDDVFHDQYGSRFYDRLELRQRHVHHP